LAAELAEALRGRLAGPNREAEAGRQAVAGWAAEGQPVDPAYQCLWRALGHDPTGMDRLVSRTRLTAAELSSMLLVMELEGRVCVEHGRYSRKR
jgi:DNA processing protein